MGYTKAVNAARRGYALRRAGWAEGEFIQGDDNGRVIKVRRDGRGHRRSFYSPTHVDEFSDDWELML